MICWGISGTDALDGVETAMAVVANVVFCKGNQHRATMMRRRESLGSSRSRATATSYGGDVQADTSGVGTTRQFVEFHPSMSLENPTSVVDFLPPPAPHTLLGVGAAAPAIPTPFVSNLTLRDVLAARNQVWAQVDAVSLTEDSPPIRLGVGKLLIHV